MKKVVENTKQKKALKAKIEVAEKLKKIQKEDPTKLAQYIDNILKESKMELETIEGKKWKDGGKMRLHSGKNLISPTSAFLQKDF